MIWSQQLKWKKSPKVDFKLAGIRLVPLSSWTMEQRGIKRAEMVGQNDKHQITVVFCGSLQGDFLPVQVIYKGNYEMSSTF